MIRSVGRAAGRHREVRDLERLDGVQDALALLGVVQVEQVRHALHVDVGQLRRVDAGPGRSIIEVP